MLIHVNKQMIEITNISIYQVVAPQMDTYTAYMELQYAFIFHMTSKPDIY